jgi:hypothetical protein
MSPITRFALGLVLCLAAAGTPGTRLVSASAAYEGAGIAINTFVESLLAGRCNVYKAKVIVAAYIDGQDLQAKGISSPVGSAYKAGPKLEYLPPTQFDYGWWCNNQDNFPAELLPSQSMMVVVGNALGAQAIPETGSNFRVYDSSGKATDCIIRLVINGRRFAAPGGIEWMSPLYTTDIRMERKDNCPKNMKIYDTGAWCDENSKGQCDSNNGPDFGTTFMVYYDDMDMARPASFASDFEALAPAPAPASSSKKNFSVVHITSLVLVLALSYTIY